jgi:hypothetical protein
MKFKGLYHYFPVLAFFIIVSFFLGNYVGFERHWSATYDQEFTLSYNALLFNNGIKMEYLDHPGYFTILFLSLFLKALSILDFISVDKLSLISMENFDRSLQEVIVYTRIYSVFLVSVFSFLNYVLIYIFSKNKSFSFLFSLIIFSSPGTIFHITQMRTELMAMLLVLIALIFLKKFLENNKFRYMHLLGFFLFMFCAALNKMQILFLYPFFLILFYPFENKIDDFDIEAFKFLNYKWVPLVLFIVLIFYIYLPNNTLHPFPFLSGIMIFFIIFITNLFFYLIMREGSKNIRVNLVIINLSLIAVFIVAKNILLIHPSTSEMIFVNLTRIMHLAQYVSETPQVDDFSNMLSFLFSKVFTFSSLIFKNIIFKYNIYSFLIFLNILMLILYRKSMTKKMVLFNFLCLLASIFVLILNSYRAGGNLMPQYYLFSDLFLIISYYNFSKIIKLHHVIIIFIISCLTSYGANLQIIEGKKRVDNRINSLCSGPYFTDWHKKINKEYFLNFCNNKSN